MGHTTGLYTVRNRTDEERVPAGFSIIKLEWTTTTRFIPAGDFRSLNGDVIPWCERVREIREKAFLFRRNATSPNDGLGAFYLFQDENGFACWTGYAGGNPSYEGRVVGLHDVAVNIDIHDGSLGILPPRFAPA